MTENEISSEELAEMVKIMESDDEYDSLSTLASDLSKAINDNILPYALKCRIKKFGIPTKTKDPAPLKSPKFQTVIGDHAALQIATPSGKCPVPLKSVEYDDIRDWVIKLHNHGKEKGVCYCASAVVYFLGKFISCHDARYSVAKSHLDEALSNFRRS